MQSAVTEPLRTARILYVIVAVLSLAGATVSGISLQRHYAKSASTFCDFSQRFNCDVVNRSEWSELAGVPVAGIGVAGYIFLFFVSTFRRSRTDTPRWLFLAALAGMGFALYLTYIEAYQLMTWCILCVASQMMIFVITVLSGVVLWSAPKS
jgi:vitamin-K-epoxide reductase (warfarin-sensitive)